MNFFTQNFLSVKNLQNMKDPEIILFLFAIICAGYILRVFWRKEERCANLSHIIAHYSKLLENTQNIMCLVFFKPQLHFKYISPSVTSTIGYLQENFYVSPEFFKSLIHPDDLPQLKMSLKKIRINHKVQLFSLRLAKPDKSFVNLEIKLIPWFDENKTCAGFYGVAHKITPQSMSQEDMLYLERLKVISQTASSIAHEIRNPVTTVRGYLQFFSLKPEFDNYREHFELLINELDRTNLIIKEYLALNQNKIKSPQLCQLNDVIHSLYPLLKAEANNIKKDIQIKLETIPELYLAENEIRQFILNMVKNGLEAMSEMNERTFVTISTYAQDDKIVMSIKDQGPGIAPNILKNIGKPFLTNKKNGTGLGLTICYKIASDHNAQIEVNSHYNGTEFLLKFSPKSRQNLIKKAMPSNYADDIAEKRSI